ncbi:hypothetical protein, conserved [Babesia ovata]|uniref:Uncharacterized protein n=1 Tax=Babesia ovata TaxID=189622 RepID=A0A2H6K6W4_9APIC|nr:uncharacterized protein BOVATA_002230 [Babesia ovata]GBE58730.1 hypothetical protein, conserved [Babesia ovata]
MSSGSKCILVGKGPPTSVKQLAALKTATIYGDTSSTTSVAKPIVKIGKAGKSGPPLITVGLGAPKAVVAHAKPKTPAPPVRITVGKCPPALSKALSTRLITRDEKSTDQNVGAGAAPPVPRKDAKVELGAPGSVSSQGSQLPKCRPQMKNRFDNIVSEIMLDLASSDSFTAYLDNTETERKTGDSSANANLSTGSLASGAVKSAVSHVIVESATKQQQVVAPTAPSEQHSKSGHTGAEIRERTATNAATAEIELLRAASKSMFDRSNLMPPPKAKQVMTAKKPAGITTKIAFKGTSGTAAADSTEIDTHPAVKSPLKAPIQSRKDVPEAGREAKATPGADKTKKLEWTPENKINILTRAANRVRMISRVMQKQDDQFDLPTEAYGYAMNRSISNASDQSLFRSPGHSGSISSAKDESANRKGDAGSAGYRYHGISRRAGLKLGAIANRYNRTSEALKQLEVKDIGTVREAHFLQPTKTVSALWSRHGNVAVARRDDAEHKEENFPVLCAVFAKRKAGAT